MITASLTGNLGNHMWIYAITRAVAYHNNYFWGFNPIPEYDYLNGKSQLDFMDIDYGITNSYKYEEIPEGINHIWKEKYIRIPYENGDIVDFHPYQPDIFKIEDNTKLYIRCCQDARYLKDIKDKVEEWFKIKEENELAYEKQMHNRLHMDERTCILNIRGGEYKNLPSVALRKEYWEQAIAHMKKNVSSHMRFIAITDDVLYAPTVLPKNIPVYHFGIGMDYYIINHAKNLILSNSSFGIFPAWLNKNNPYVIAPRYWARHNVSTGYWASSDMWTFKWNFLDRDGLLYEK